MKTLKKHPIIAAIAILFSLAGCNGVTKEDEEKIAVETSHQQQIQDLTNEKALNDSVQLAFVQTLNEIDQNLDHIREKQGTLILGPGSNVEQGITTKEHISRNISIINSLMEQNKKKLQKLNAQLKKSKTENILLAKLTEGTTARIAKQEEEIKQLKIVLADQSFEMATLNIKMNDVQLANATLQDKADQLDRDFHRVYYAVGSYDELQKQNVMARSRGLLGIRTKKTLKEDFTKDYFTAIDVRQAKYIPVFAKKVTLVTFHPKNSYKLTKESDLVTYIEIKDPEEFWKTSKFLVVEVHS